MADELTAEYLQDTLAVCVLQIKWRVEPTCSGPTNTVLLMWDGGGGGAGVEMTGVWCDQHICNHCYTSSWVEAEEICFKQDQRC